MFIVYLYLGTNAVYQHPPASSFMLDSYRVEYEEDFPVSPRLSTCTVMSPLGPSKITIFGKHLHFAHSACTRTARRRRTMPKSAPRRKRIRAARSEADPTGLSARAEGGADAEAGATQSPAAVGKKGAAKKAKEGKVSKGDVKDKDLLPLLEKVGLLRLYSSAFAELMMYSLHVYQMQASASSDRLWSTSAVAHVLASSDANVRRALQAKNIVGLLIERLADEEVEVQVEACGALRNLAIEGSFEVCAEVRNTHGGNGEMVRSLTLAL